jgi:hypothetical protein
VKHLKVKVRTAYNRRKLGDHYQQELKTTIPEIVVSENKCTGIIPARILQNVGKSWAQFYRC